MSPAGATLCRSEGEVFTKIRPFLVHHPFGLALAAVIVGSPFMEPAVPAYMKVPAAAGTGVPETDVSLARRYLTADGAGIRHVVTLQTPLQCLCGPVNYIPGAAVGRGIGKIKVSHLVQVHARPETGRQGVDPGDGATVADRLSPKELSR